MDCECSCHGPESEGPSRRTVLGVLAAAAVAAPMLNGAVQAADAPAAGGWVKTVKPSEVADKSAKAIKGANAKLSAILVRDGKTIHAFSPKCTHKACDVAPQTDKPLLHCKCHGAEFDLTGNNTRGPGKGTPPASLDPLGFFALRLNADGVIEVDTSKTVAKDAKDANLTVDA